VLLLAGKVVRLVEPTQNGSSHYLLVYYTQTSSAAFGCLYLSGQRGER
jgi:hypothetical protein